MFSLVLDSLWLMGCSVLVAVTFFMLRRGLHRDFPLFLSYTAFVFVSSTSLFFLKDHYSLYFYTYWASATLSVLIEFAVMYEIFKHIFRPYDALRKMALILFRWAAVVLIMVGVVVAASSAPNQWSRIFAAILALERSMRVMQVGLVLFLFLFSQQVGLTHNHRVFGISLGFGLIAATDLTLVTLRATMGTVASEVFNMLKTGAYLCSTIVWLQYVLLREPERVRVEQVYEAQHWNYALANATAAEPPTQDAFIPMIESAVERVLQHRRGSDIESKS